MNDLFTPTSVKEDPELSLRAFGEVSRAGHLQPGSRSNDRMEDLMPQTNMDSAAIALPETRGAEPSVESLLSSLASVPPGC